MRVVGLMLLVIAAAMLITARVKRQPAYNEEKARVCLIKGKLESGAGYKVSPKWILIMETEGHIFDLDVSPATWWKAEVGKYMTFYLSEGEINYQPEKQSASNTSELFMILGVVVLLISLCTFIGFWNEE